MNNADRMMWFFVGVAVGLVIGYWDKISALWSNRAQLSGAQKIQQGLEELLP